MILCAVSFAYSVFASFSSCETTIFALISTIMHWWTCEVMVFNWTSFCLRYAIKIMDDNLKIQISFCLSLASATYVIQSYAKQSRTKSNRIVKSPNSFIVNRKFRCALRQTHCTTCVFTYAYEVITLKQMRCQIAFFFLFINLSCSRIESPL